MNGGGRAWVDDIKLEVVGKDVPVTDLELELKPNDQPNIHAPVLPDKPVNRDFEKCSTHSVMRV